MTLKRALLAFLIGALVLTPWDIGLVNFGVVVYRGGGSLLGSALWTPFAFGASSLGTVFLFNKLDNLLIIKKHYPFYFLLFEYALIAGFYLAIFNFHGSPYVLSLSLLLLVIIRLIFLHFSWDLLFFLVGACIGPTLELILTTFNLYLFTEPDFLGMPCWLPVIWGTIALAFRRLAWVLIQERNKVIG